MSDILYKMPLLKVHSASDKDYVKTDGTFCFGCRTGGNPRCLCEEEQCEVIDAITEEIEEKREWWGAGCGVVCLKYATQEYMEENFEEWGGFDELKDSRKEDKELEEEIALHCGASEKVYKCSDCNLWVTSTESCCGEEEEEEEEEDSDFDIENDCPKCGCDRGKHDVSKRNYLIPCESDGEWSGDELVGGHDQDWWNKVGLPFVAADKKKREEEFRKSRFYKCLDNEVCPCSTCDMYRGKCDNCETELSVKVSIECIFRKHLGHRQEQTFCSDCWNDLKKEKNEAGWLNECDSDYEEEET